MNNEETLTKSNIQKYFPQLKYDSKADIFSEEGICVVIDEESESIIIYCGKENYLQWTPPYNYQKLTVGIFGALYKLLKS